MIAILLLIILIFYLYEYFTIQNINYIIIYLINKDYIE